MRLTIRQMHELALQDIQTELVSNFGFKSSLIRTGDKIDF